MAHPYSDNTLLLLLSGFPVKIKRSIRISCFINWLVTTTMIDAILDRALRGRDLTPAEGVELLQQRDPQAIAQIRATADRLRQMQVGETVTYVVNRNLNFTNICEQHCSFCAFRRDEGDAGAFWLDRVQILEKVADGVRRGATEICMQGGLNPKA